MLKLIYSLSDKEITLKYQKKSSFWTKELFIALILSLVAHLLGIALFNIRPLKPLSELVLVPGAVISEIKMGTPKLFKTHVDEYGFLQSPPIPPAYSQLTAHGVLTDSLPAAFEDEKKQIFYDPFLNLEKNHEQLIVPQVHLYKMQSPIQIQLSDNLKERCFGLKIKPKNVLLGSTETLHCRFVVEVEDRSGKIFAADLVRSCGSSKYDHYAKNLIHNLKFEKKVSSFSTRGEVDILIEADARDIYD